MYLQNIKYKMAKFTKREVLEELLKTDNVESTVSNIYQKRDWMLITLKV